MKDYAEESQNIYHEREEQAEARDIRIQEWAKLAYDERREIDQFFLDSDIDELAKDFDIFGILEELDLLDSDDLCYWAIEISDEFFEERHKPENKALKAYILKQLEEYADGFVE